VSFYPPWNSDLEPNQGNVRSWLDNLYARFMPSEQSRWNQSNIDSLFYAGEQSFLNRYFGNSGHNSSNSNYYFNICQQPINMVTGYQRQHRKNFSYVSTEGADPQTTDQYTKLITHVANTNHIHEQFSRACEQSAITGMALLQPYLDYTGDDQAQGELKVKLWEYNSFLCDPYARSLTFEDSQFIWCQEYISKREAESRFPDKKVTIMPMSGTPQRYGNFYFLPENYNMARNDLMVLSYVWYKWKRKKKRLYSRTRNQFFDVAGGDGNLDILVQAIPDLEEVSVEVPTWKLATILNDQLMFQGDNPLGFDGCPFVPVLWNYEPHINYYDLRVRGLIRTMRSPQFLFNHKVIQNNDIAAATINAGWKRKVGAVANEDNLKKAGQGWDVIINDGYEMTDVEKIIPSAVPESDLALAQQMADLIYNTSGINLENWSGQEDKQTSSLTVLLKQAANLMVFQKYFDQWDQSLKTLGDRLLQIVLNNWSAEKVGMLIGEEPTAHFYSKVFAKYNVIVEESDLTPTQQNLQASQMMEMNERFQREIFSPSQIIPKLNITGKAEIIKILESQEQQAQAASEHSMHLEHAVEEAKLKELYAKTTMAIANARERHGRAESNIGLFEERLSMIGRNNSMSTKAKMEALEKLVEVTHRYGELEAHLKMNNIQSLDTQEQTKEDVAKNDAKRTSLSNDFVAQMLAGMSSQQDQGQEQEQNIMNS
jgi:hypothetical protein